MDKDILIINEAASFLRVSATTLRRYIASRQITFYKLQGKILFRKTDLEKFLDSKRVDSFEEFRNKNILWIYIFLLQIIPFAHSKAKIFNIDDSIAMQGRKKVIRKNVVSMEEQAAYWEHTAILFRLDNT